jgi:hypothetical protein
MLMPLFPYIKNPRTFTKQDVANLQRRYWRTRGFSEKLVLQTRLASPCAVPYASVMRTILRSVAATASLVLLSACASTPDPAVVCSSEWIAPRAEKAVSRIEKRAKSSFRTLGKVSTTWSSGKTPGPLQLFALSRALKGLEKEMTQGQGIKDLKTVAKTCNDPKIISTSMRDLMERQGVSEKLIQQIEDNPIYQNVISSITEPERVDASR